jgi:hypothetical protein
MQLSTSISSPDSGLLPLPPALPGSAPFGEAPTGAFADFMSASAPTPPAPNNTPSPVPSPLPITIPGGIVRTLAAVVPANVAIPDSPAPVALTPTSATDCAPAAATPAPLVGEVEVEVEVTVAARVSNQSTPTPLSAARTGTPRALPSSPILRSARALPRTESAPGENVSIPQFPSVPLPVAAAIALPLDLTSTPHDDIASGETGDVTSAEQAPPRPYAARSPWIMPGAQLVCGQPFVAPSEPTATTGTPTSAGVTACAETAPLTSVQPTVTPANRGPRSSVARTTIADSSSSPGLEFRTEQQAPSLSSSTLDRESSAGSTTPVFASAIPVAINTLPRVTAFVAAPSTASAPVATPSTEFVVENASETTGTAVPGNRPATRVSPRAEKFAALRPEIFSPLISTSFTSNKNFLSKDSNEVTSTPEHLGIDVAKSPSTMSATTASPRFTAASPAVLDVNAVAAPAPPPASAPSAAPATTAEITAAAHKAVDAVLASTERLTSATQSSVDLKFSIGGADLDVRIEVRAGAVHATFRTDSPELRTALAQEWQTTNSQPADHALRLAPPVFTAGDRSGSDTGAGSFGEQSQHARDQGARPSAEFVLPGGVRNRLASASSASTAGASTRPARSVPATTLHLHAFA